jgi:hypothetical protein
MEKAQKVIVVLLVLAVLFSGVSIFVSYAVLNVDLPDGSTTGQSISEEGGGISLSIEKPPIVGEGLG